MRLINNLDLKGKKVLLRDDLNVTFGPNGSLEDFRIAASLPTIRFLKDHGAKVIIMSHLGRPNGCFDRALSLKPVAKRLEEYLRVDVVMANDCVGKEVRETIDDMKNGDIVMLENLRFHDEEERNDPAFSKELASLGDIYINDAFGASHRAHASIAGITEWLPSYAGFLLEKEVSVLSGVFEHAKKPLVVVIGGAKISTKIKIIKNFVSCADEILLGGALANTVLYIKGIAIGGSLFEEGFEEEVRGLEITNCKIHLPVDIIVSKDNTGKSPKKIMPIGKTDPEEMILDIGPDTISLFSQAIKEAGTVVWNGPMGYFEVPEFSAGTREIAEAVAESNAFTIVGGGDSVPFLVKLGLDKKISHLSTGGGAMLEFLGGDKMPGLEVLE